MLDNAAYRLELSIDIRYLDLLSVSEELQHRGTREVVSLGEYPGSVMNGVSVVVWTDVLSNLDESGVPLFFAYVANWVFKEVRTVSYILPS